MTRLKDPCPIHLLAPPAILCFTTWIHLRLGCSQANRNMPTEGAEDILTKRFLDLLSNRAHPKTLCPSEVARSFSKSELSDLGVSEWRDLMPDLRDLSFAMRDSGIIEILQRGQIVTAGIEDVRGPIRIRLTLRDGDGRG
jgi:hypothetical protein